GVWGVTGTFNGSLVASHVQQCDVPGADHAWLVVHPHQWLTWDPKRTLRQLLDRFYASPRGWLHELSRVGLFSRSGLNELIDQFLDLEAVSKSPVAAWVACRRLNPAFVPSSPWDFAAAGPVKYFRLN